MLGILTPLKETRAYKDIEAEVTAKVAADLREKVSAEVREQVSAEVEKKTLSKAREEYLVKLLNKMESLYQRGILSEEEYRSETDDLRRELDEVQSGSIGAGVVIRAPCVFLPLIRVFFKNRG